MTPRTAASHGRLISAHRLSRFLPPLISSSHQFCFGCVFLSPPSPCLGFRTTLRLLLARSFAGTRSMKRAGPGPLVFAEIEVDNLGIKE